MMVADAPRSDTAAEAMPAPPCAMVIFGAGGDLTKRLVIPALYNLAASGSQPQEFALGRDYRQEPDVTATSAVETFVALKLEIDTWRWAGVPFYLRTGKSMSSRWTEIAIRFRSAPLSVFQGANVSRMPPNWLVLQIQPDEGISFQFQVKRPGQAIALSPVRTSFGHRDWFPPRANVGYETLIHDCMIGDASLFQRADMVKAAWRIVQAGLDAWAAQKPTDFPNYRAGSDRPEAAEALLANDGGRA